MAKSTCTVVTDQSNKELMEHSMIMFPLACYENDLALFSVPWHWHDEFEFIVITKGRAPVQIENNIIELKQGDGLFINGGVLHCIDCEQVQCGEYQSLVFHPKLIGGSIDSVFWQRLITPVLQDASLQYIYMDAEIAWQNEIIQDMIKAWQVVVDETEDYENYARYCLTRALGVMNQHIKPVDSHNNRKERTNVERLKYMIQFIESHYAEEIVLEEIAKSASVSKSVCLRCFRQVIGCSPIRYLVQYRIEKAAQQLQETDARINEIAMACGFSDISYFSKCFHECKGWTPLEYRKMSKKRVDSFQII